METDKLLAEYSLRIPDVTKFEIDKLTSLQKSELNNEIRITMARAIHAACFDPEKYLKTE